MNAQKNLEQILNSREFAPNITVNRLLPAQEGIYAGFPKELDGRIVKLLTARGISRLYTHQREVWEHAANGKNVMVVTPTASGKTLCYNLPCLQELLRNEKSRCLYMFPTKALSQDQQAELNELSGGGENALGLKIATYDGDTPESLRVSARNDGRIIISNPDMLHAGILPNHTKWVKFFSQLKFVIIDEAHTYRGVLGSHVANVIRRLRRVAAFYGAAVQFILCSATIANPKELGEALIGGEAELVDKNGAPRGEKRIILYNPPLLDPIQGIRKSALTESRKWMLSLLKAGIKTILFAHSRVKTEVAASYVNEDLANVYTDNSRIRVESYRGGLLPNERREIEKGLRDGSIQGVVSTNALELGIDIGGLDASIIAGFPGSFGSFWQQSGRAGRGGGTSVSVFIATSSAIDQFIMNDPDWFFRKSAEEGRIDPDNPYILTDHVKCACFELPFVDSEFESGPFSEGALYALEYLEEAGVARHAGGKWHWSDRSYPAEGISLRSATVDNVVIIDATDGRNNVIGEMDRPSAKELIFPKAVYIHRGRQYLVETLDIENRKCIVREADVNYFTDGIVKTDIKVLTQDSQFSYHAAENARLGGSLSGRLSAAGVLSDVLVRSQATKFKKLKFRTHENIGFGNIELPQEEMQTRALVLLFGAQSEGGKALAKMDEQEVAASLYGLGTMLRGIAPVFLLCDPRDLGVAERARDVFFGCPALYVYDKYPGGTGLSESLAPRAQAVFSAVFAALERCPCKRGCPSCTGPGGGKDRALEFLRALSYG